LLNARKDVPILCDQNRKLLGLSPSVIFLWADQLPNPGWQYLTPDEQRMLFYVALTRAKHFLAVTCSGGSAFLDLLSKKTEAIA
jgi:hypothetical protein